jgi:energy-coupling factor transporter ATP-binding protein EcfA2
MDTMPDILLFVGDLLEEPSEIQFLNRLSSDLIKLQKSAIIFTNFHAGKANQQIDFFVITPNCACVVELKNFTIPVFGQVNGPWELKSTDGTLVKSLGERNPYHQALNAKYAISDEMHILLAGDPELAKPPGSKSYVYTIESVVCIFPEIPHGSNLTAGDFKAYVKGYGDFLKFLLVGGKSPGWTKYDWIKLANNLNLQQRDVSRAAYPNQREASEQSELYLGRFIDYYGRNLPEFVPIQISVDNKSCALESLLRVLSVEKSLQVVGPSGCGKTHLIKHLALLSIESSHAPIFISAKYFGGFFSDLLDRSVMHLYDGNGLELLATLSASGRKPFFIIDGINECPAHRIPELIETIQAFALRRKHIVIFTSQKMLELPTELKGAIIRLDYLTDLEKRKVLAAYLQQPPANVEAVLEVIKTPFEISLLAKSTLELGSDFTKYTLFNSYARKSLECCENSSLAFRTLVNVGQIMAERLLTAIPESEFKRNFEIVSEDYRIRPDAFSVIPKSGLIEIRQGYCSFSHEMVQYFFEAEAFLSKYSSTAERATEMERPRNHHLADFVLGAQGDTQNTRVLIKSSAFHRPLLEAIKGRYGKYAKAAVLTDISILFKKADEEVEKLDLTFKKSADRFGIAIEPTTGMDWTWTSYEIALMNSIGQAFSREGLFMNQVINLLKKTDRKCFQLLESKEIPHIDKILLQESLCFSLYVAIPQKQLPISIIIQQIRPMWEGEFTPELECTMKSLLQDLDNQPIGVLFLLCNLMRGAKAHFTSELPNLLKRCWKTKIYNLRLDALNAVQDHTHQVEEPVRSELIGIVKNLYWEGNLGLSTTITEVLASYEALEIGITVDDVTKEIIRLLEDWENPFNYEHAYTIYTYIFEDVFQGVYYEAIYNLPSENRAKLLTMAALGAPDYSFNIGWILQQLVEMDFSNAIKAYLKWGIIPYSEVPSIDEAIRAFLWAIIGLAYHSDKLPHLNRPLRDDEAAWRAYGEILFWLHKPSITESDMREKCAPCWERLESLYIRAALDPLFLIEKSIRWGAEHNKVRIKDPIIIFPSEVKAILTECVKIMPELTSLFKFVSWRRQERNKFIVEMLGKIGDETTIPFLEPILESAELGAEAARAIHDIRGRKIK